MAQSFILFIFLVDCLGLADSHHLVQVLRELLVESCHLLSVLSLVGQSFLHVHVLPDLPQDSSNFTALEFGVLLADGWFLFLGEEEKGCCFFLIVVAKIGFKLLFQLLLCLFAELP
jgi:hypothetical protein